MKPEKAVDFFHTAGKTQSAQRSICERKSLLRFSEKVAVGTAKFFTLLSLLYHTSVKSQGIKQLMAGGGVALVGITLIPLLSGLFG